MNRMPVISYGIMVESLLLLMRMNGQGGRERARWWWAVDSDMDGG